MLACFEASLVQTVQTRLAMSLPSKSNVGEHGEADAPDRGGDAQLHGAPPKRQRTLRQMLLSSGSGQVPGEHGYSRVCIYICICIYVYVYVYICICIYMYMYVYIYVYIYTYVYVSVFCIFIKQIMKNLFMYIYKYVYI